MQIITNNKPRELIYGYQLTEKEYQDFDYLGEYGSEGMMLEQFIRYKGGFIILVILSGLKNPENGLMSLPLPTGTIHCKVGMVS